ncbi:GPI mannosyltransferase 2 [Diplodia seriata]|uniref:GPI mannosyltransferase 2 n=1 Tax=Diplodia seriata TaxID=420778 RepID=A0A1S8BGA2_9PEZI|nr:GPI mannosyltransferase 2 [Diplodia seriata]
MPRLDVLHRPYSALVIVFAAWKTLLLLIAFASPGPGYDTSTTLLLGHDAAASTLGAAAAPWAATLGQRLVSKLVRWDAIYFTAAAERGYQHEQEWAFSWAFSHLMANAAKTLRKTAFLTAVLHVLSPAGLFLAAPYGEALFSLLNFLGMLCYAYARVQPNGQAAHLLCMLVSGLCFGLATMVRSNGLLSGLILLYDVLRALPGFLGPSSEMIATLMRLVGPVLAGCMVAGGSLIPQWVAYQQYCTLVSMPQVWLSNFQLTQTRTK